MKTKKCKYYYFLLLLLLNMSSLAQEKETYIQPFEQNLSIRLNASIPFLNLNQYTSQSNYEFEPNNPLKAGIGLSIKNTLIDFTLGGEFDFLRNKKKGKTESFDFQIHHYGSSYIIDLVIQQYQGFYTESHSDKDIKLYPDLKILQYGLQGQYVFNHKKFSYKAAFPQSEKQIHRAGTALIGGSIYFTNIQSDSLSISKSNNTLHNFQFGLNGGYAYNWVLGKHWFISASLALGINIGNEKIKHFAKRKIEIYPSAFQRVAVGYNHDSWSLGFTSINNITCFSGSLNRDSNLFSGMIQVSYIRRFHLSFKPIRIRSKKEN